MKAIIVQTTCSSKKEATKIAKVLIKKKLAACIQINKIKSFYKWEEKFCKDKEILLSIKTKKKNFSKIKSIIKKIHSYEVPEIISFKIYDISQKYREFIRKNC
ncbi:MAG: divalent-cation tolerance protein CutA [Arcobacter sp.]|nr:divalent-cation tolerance protein CutA [Arcobacter sp.]